MTGPFNGGAPPAALFYFSCDRKMVHSNKHFTNWQGILRSDVYTGYIDLYRSDRDPGPVTRAFYWGQARRKFFELAHIAGNVRKGKPAHDISPIAPEAAQRIDEIFDIDPQAWPAGVLRRLPDMPVSRVQEVLRWNWKTAAANVKAA
jgi:hypothetical protein